MTISHIIEHIIGNEMKINYLLMTLLLTVVTNAQPEILDEYIKIGLQNNLALKQKEFSLRKSMAALDEARGYFFPSVDITARYSRADGGRTIDFPIGDIVNPIHTGLNQLLNSQIYPTNIPNQEFFFLREKEHDTKLNITQTIFDAKIYNNYSLKSNLVEASKEERNVYARQLIKEIKTAYNNYLKTVEVEKLYWQTKKLLEENLRAANKLFENDKVTKDNVYRAQAELSKIEQDLLGAEKDKELAASYFNFLLNRNLDAEIKTIEQIDDYAMLEVNEESLYKIAVDSREELKQLKHYINAAENSKDMARANLYPGLYFSFDYGYQGEKYKFTDEYDYWMASLVLKWNLFNGFKDEAKAEQSEWDKKKLESQRDELIKQINLQLKSALKDFEVAEKSLTTAELRKETAEKSFEIVNKKYENGLASQIEYLDAQTTLTQASINHIITKYDYKISYAELERTSAMNELPQFIIKDEE
ncbi:MAG: TolC family protein [Ignavibacterium sp.]